MRPVEEFFRDFARPAFKAAGFTRQGRFFRRTSERGDLALAEIRSFPVGGDSLGFWIKAALWPEPYCDLRGRPPDGAGGVEGALWSEHFGPDPLITPATFGPDVDWGSATLTGREQWGQLLHVNLERRLLPFLEENLNRSRFFTNVRSERIRLHASQPLAECVLGVDDQPISMLVDAIARLGRRRVKEQRALIDFVARRRSLGEQGVQRIEEAVQAATELLPPMLHFSPIYVDHDGRGTVVTDNPNRQRIWKWNGVTSAEGYLDVDLGSVYVAEISLEKRRIDGYHHDNFLLLHGVCPEQLTRWARLRVLY